MKIVVPNCNITQQSYLLGGLSPRAYRDVPAVADEVQLNGYLAL